jgi:predicted nucleotidyltransferase
VAVALAAVAEASAVSAAVARVAEARAAVGKGKAGDAMIPETNINDFVSRLRQAGGTNLLSVILYGSAATGDYVPDHSDVNLLCVLRETSFEHLRKLAPVVESWTKSKNRMPLVMGTEELRRSADVFSIELMDMRDRYRVLWGEDVLGALVVPVTFHRVQLEYELREKTILLRQGLLGAAGNASILWDIMLRSLPTFATLFRHTLLELGEPATSSKQEAVQQLAVKVGFDPGAFLQLMAIREKKTDRQSVDINELCGRYLMTVEQVTSAVDKMLDSSVAGDLPTPNR